MQSNDTKSFNSKTRTRVHRGFFVPERKSFD
ncbi:hypothetical protein VPHD479_0037 [Vibrio phage D479]